MPVSYTQLDVYKRQSYGCNSLIKQGAGIIYNIDEFVSDITLTGFTECTQMDFRKNILDKKEALVYSLLDFCPIDVYKRQSLQRLL